MFEYLRKRITMKLLLVEDDKELNRTLTYQLEKEGFAVDSCLDGEEACYYMEEGLYDLVLLDRMLPKLDGIGVLTEMRKKGDMTPVIMLTALGALTDKITGLDCGADDYLVKPFDFEELAARIRSIGRRGPGGWKPLKSSPSQTSAMNRWRPGLPALRIPVPSPDGKGLSWKPFCATLASPSPARFCCTGSGGRIRTWRREIWITIFIFCAGV